ncbi:MAG: PP0621 family protein [Pseudomonadota bacterium]|nr:PP0621 family protein [Pseudomonadota bacterium]
MKFLLLLVVVVVAVWLWRSGRLADAASKRKPSPPPPPQDMVRCAHCGVHFPQADAVAGRNGLYCCVEHRQRAES